MSNVITFCFIGIDDWRYKVPQAYTTANDPLRADNLESLWRWWAEPYIHYSPFPTNHIISTTNSDLSSWARTFSLSCLFCLLHRDSTPLLVISPKRVFYKSKVKIFLMFYQLQSEEKPAQINTLICERWVCNSARQAYHQPAETGLLEADPAAHYYREICWPRGTSIRKCVPGLSAPIRSCRRISPENPSMPPHFRSLWNRYPKNGPRWTGSSISYPRGRVRIHR